MLRFRGVAWGMAMIAALSSSSSSRGGSEPRSIFDGKDLDGWVAEGVSKRKDGSPVWTVSDGMIHCAGNGFGFLRYDRREYEDFRFHAEFRIEPKCNSGIGIRTGVFDPRKTKETRPSLYSYEIQLTDDAGKAPDVHSSGSLYRYVAPRESAMKPPGQWNLIEITCVGPRIKVLLNGSVVIDVDQSAISAIKNKPLKGNVCLQNHGGTIDFRNLSVTELDHADGAAARSARLDSDESSASPGF